jgi:hypothetical protein
VTGDPARLQRAVVDWLASPAAHGGAPVERIDTHSAVVVLAGDRALKLKRAVKYDYLDFSTEPLRRAACEAEVRLNRRTAPLLYRGVVAVTRDTDGALALDGRGEAVDWLVDMNRFRQEDLLDRLAASGALSLDLMPALGSAIAAFHAAADHRDDYGGAAGMRWVVDGNAAGFAEEGRDILDPSEAAALTADARSELDRQAALLDRRRQDGFVRQCHGDLHLRNLVLVDGRPTLFDAIEFNDAIACVDVFYDLAFLLMDLWRRPLRAHANSVLNAYIVNTGDVGGLALLPLFLSCRAAVRAKTSATAARLQTDAGGRRDLEDLARSYLHTARAFLRPPPPVLVAIGGYSGAGKSTLARTLAPDLGAAPGALVARSDVVRKTLLEVADNRPLGQDGYTAEVTARVYAAMGDRAAMALAGGHSAIADAVFARQDHRAAIEAVAVRAGAAFIGLWLDAPLPVLVSRVTARAADASDADEAVVRRQLAGDPGAIDWQRIDASGPPAEVVDRARRAAGIGR